MFGRLWMWPGVLTLITASCIVDDPPCGARQHRVESGYLAGCVCDRDAVPNADGVGCHACGPHEQVKAGMCACETGYERANSAAECMAKEDMPDSDSGAQEAGTRGQDMPCSSASECAGLDATYCLTLQPPSRCLVQGCADGTHPCASDRDCCVISVLPELAATGGLCVPMGTCSAPGMVVTP
jgi:hypothetical protein